ncbi:MAG: helix-turn-helix domain-containing protein [Tissierellia bacterium]|nr:helix-turn-helix domain-containing protein [Tissierellia bacterium]
MEVLLKELNQNIKQLIDIIENANQSVFNAREAARYLKISYDSLLRYTRIGAIEHVRNGTSYLYKKEYLDRWLEKNRRGAV